MVVERRSILRIALLSLCVLASALLVMRLLPKRGFQPLAQRLTLRKSIGEFSIHDVRHLRYERGRKLFSLRVGTLQLRRKRVGIFHLGFYKIAHLADVRLTLFESSASSPGSVNGARRPFAALPWETGYEGLPQLKTVKGIELTNVTVNFQQVGVTVSTLRSERAHLDVAGQVMIFAGHVTLRSRASGLLRCSKLRWNYVTHRVAVPGRFTWESPAGALSGRRLITTSTLTKVRFVRMKARAL